MRTPILLLVSLSLAACTASETGEPDGDAGSANPEAMVATAFADSDVQRVHSRMMEAMDPSGAYQKNRYLAFTWIVQRADGDPVARSHRWDRWSGDVRVEGPTDQGKLVALFNVADPPAGRIWVDGAEITDESRAERLARAHGMHVNDSYWFVMPFKWADPGVTTRFLGDETDDDGNDWQVVELSFEDVGRTPQNVYRAYINPASGLMERWAHFRTADANPSYSGWTQWTEIGGVNFPLDRPWPNGGRIYFEGVELLADVPADAWVPPAA